MQFNVAQLLKEPIGATRLYELNESLTGLDAELKFLGPLVGQVQFLRTNSGILVSGQLSTAIQTGCNRCAEPIAVPVRFALEENFHPLTEVFSGRYLRRDEYEGDEADLDDVALSIDEQHILNLAEVVRQAIWLALPMYPGCSWEGAGECPNLVRHLQELDRMENVEFYSEALRREQKVEKDPRWSALLRLRDDEQNA